MTHVCDYKGEKSYKQHEGRKYLSQFFERYAYMILYGLVAYAHGFGNLLVGHAAERLIRNILRRRGGIPAIAARIIAAISRVENVAAGS